MRSIIIAVLFSVLLQGCGGGDRADPPSRQAAGAGRAQTVTESNQIVTADGPGLTGTGASVPVTARLSRSATVLQATTPATSFEFTATVPLAGAYELFAWWPEGLPATGRVRATVIDAGGRTSVTLDQSHDAGQWVSIGIFPLRPDRPLKVNLASAGEARVVADAVRLQYLGPAASVRIDADRLPLGNVSSPYQTRVEAAGRPPLRWALAGGALPAGLSMDAATGEIKGVPEETGEYRFTLVVTDAGGGRASKEVSIDVLRTLDAPVAPPPSSAPPAKRRLQAAEPSAGADLSHLLTILDGVPEGSWVQVGENSFSEVWTPADQRPLLSKSNPDPGSIIQAWSSFAWDAKRGDLWIYGGGHANYNGNDVYRWRATERRWERASLPSQITNDDLGNVVTVDGPFSAPVSAHTYDNNIFLPITDRFVSFGGATSGRGGPYKLQVDATTQRNTGPYFFDPARADGSKVGGKTGSHVQRVAPYPGVTGGEMWLNRDLYGNMPSGSPMPTSFINGCTGYAEENGRDVVYMAGRAGGTALALYKYTVGDVGDPTTDTVQAAGRYWVGTSRQTSCAVDTRRNLLLRTGENAEPFFYWNLDNAASGNRDLRVYPVDPTGAFDALLATSGFSIYRCGMDFDPVRGRYLLWCAGGTVWAVTPPDKPVTTSGWLIQKQPDPVGAMPDSDPGRGILGKWKYIRNLDAFIGLQDNVHGHIWVYKPVGWQRPAGGTVNLRPTVSLDDPQDGHQFESGQAIALSATAADPDGTVTSVAFYNGMVKIGEASGGSPYQFVWANPPVGDLRLRAIATDNLGATTVSSSISVTVLAGASGTIVLQDGQGGYAGSADTYLSSYHPSRNYGVAVEQLDQYARYTSLYRFKIFASEGGPIPDASDIVAARLHVYKHSKYNMRYLLHPMLVPWTESEATWQQRQAGVPWASPGGRGAGADFAVNPDAEFVVGYDPAWLSFDVTSAVIRMRDAPGTNMGWAMIGASGYVSGLKRFYTREITADTQLRPKLEITYGIP